MQPTKFTLPAKTLALLLCLSLTGCTTPAYTETYDTTQDTTIVTEHIDETEENDVPSGEMTADDTITNDAIINDTIAGEALLQAITALPDDDTLRQSDIADVVTDENLDTLSAEVRTELWNALTDCDSLTAYRTRFHQITGYTFHAWREILSGTAPITDYIDGQANLVFTGDVCLGDEWYNMLSYHQKGDDITNHFSETVRTWLSSADIALMNCECTLSDRGSPTPNKLYTFRGKPENANIFTELGVDIVSLANNHAHDYGQDAFLDTMTALDSAGVVYVGAGQNRDEAMAYKSFVAEGMKIAYVAASDAEKYRLTPGATEDSPGILLMYEETDVLTAIDTAAREADVVIAYVHWGTENSTAVNADQIEKRDLFIAHGADMIIGAHPHVLQSWEVVDGVPVVYSLGNFWFNMETVDTALASVDVSLNESGVVADCTVYACTQTGGVVVEK